MPPPPPIPIRGVCVPLFVFDIAFAIDLDHAERLIAAREHGQKEEGTERPALRPSRKSPPYFEYSPPPLRVGVPAPAVPIGGPDDQQPFTTLPSVELLAFDFGAVCVSYRVPLACDAAALPGLSAALFDHPGLGADARARVEAFARAIHAAARKPGWARQVEDYIIYQVHGVSIAGEDVPPARLLELPGGPALLARTLRAETAAMSEEETADALSARASYRPGDAAIIDWNAAVLLDADADDLRPVLEFANVELLEMRFLDDRLDEALDRAYAASQERLKGLRAIFPTGARRLRRIAQYQTDGALLFEGVNSALKLVGDQYLARVYRLAAGRLHLPERDAIIERKLDTLQSIYTKLSDHEAGRRAETLEWIIILLILFEVVMGLADRL